jgi:hypothetical protein
MLMWGKRKQLDERLLDAYRASPSDFPELNGWNPEVYFAAVCERLSDAQRGIPPRDLIRFLLVKYAPDGLTSKA